MSNFRTASLPTLLAVLLGGAGCAHPTSPTPANSGGAPATEPRPIPATLALSQQALVGRIISCDPSQGFAVVELVNEAPAEAVADGAVLVVRSLDLRETARVRASRYLKGKMLGTNIVSGRPAVGDEVVFPPR